MLKTRNSYAIRMHKRFGRAFVIMLYETVGSLANYQRLFNCIVSKCVCLELNILVHGALLTWALWKLDRMLVFQSWQKRCIAVRRTSNGCEKAANICMWTLSIEETMNTRSAMCILEFDCISNGVMQRRRFKVAVALVACVFSSSCIQGELGRDKLVRSIQQKLWISGYFSCWLPIVLDRSPRFQLTNQWLPRFRLPRKTHQSNCSILCQ